MELHHTHVVDYSTPTITFVELTGVEAAEVALLDLAFADDEWLHEQETTVFVPARPLRGRSKSRRKFRFGDDLLKDPWFKSIVA